MVEFLNDVICLENMDDVTGMENGGDVIGLREKEIDLSDI